MKVLVTKPKFDLIPGADTVEEENVLSLTVL